MSGLRVTVGEQSWTYDPDALTLADAFAIKSVSGLALGPFRKGLADLDPLALQTLVWWCRTKAGERIAREDVQFRMGDFDVDPMGEQVDPPVAAATTSGPDATA